MARSHPPTLITLVHRCLVDERLATRGQRVLVAVSGGPDSMALLDVLARLRAKLGFALVAHGVDHGLRSEAGDELALAASLARDLEVPFAVTQVNVPEGGNLQSRARDARAAALRGAAAHVAADAIATAHHADDRAETVLLRLLRGAGPRGLACLPPRAGDLIRPMLRARRTDVLAHLARHRIASASDPSNVDSRFMRVRVRRELLPLLRDLSPGIVAHLNGLADDLGRLPDDLWPPGTRRAHRAMAARGPVVVRMNDCEESLLAFARGRLMITKVSGAPPSTRDRVDGSARGWQAHPRMSDRPPGSGHRRLHRH